MNTQARFIYQTGSQTGFGAEEHSADSGSFDLITCYLHDNLLQYNSSLIQCKVSKSQPQTSI